MREVWKRLQESLMKSLPSPLHKNATIHEVNAMLATFKNVLFGGHNHLLTIGTNDLTLYRLSAREAESGQSKIQVLR